MTKFPLSFSFQLCDIIFFVFNKRAIIQNNFDTISIAYVIYTNQNKFVSAKYFETFKAVTACIISLYHSCTACIIVVSH